MPDDRELPRPRAGTGGGRKTRTVAAPSDARMKADPDNLCGAQLQKSTGTCQKTKGERTSHPGYGNCIWHGGNTEAGKKAAARLMGQDLMRQYKADNRFGGNRQDPSIANLTPESALLEEVRRSAAMVRFLEERISHWGMSIGEDTMDQFLRLTPSGKQDTAPIRKEEVRDFLEGLDVDNPDSPNYLPELITETKTGFSAFTNAREWLYLYREERNHLMRVAKAAIDAGVAQRLVSLAEDQGRIMATALRVVLNALDLSPEQQARIPLVVPPVLRAIANDQPIPDLAAVTGITS